MKIKQLGNGGGFDFSKTNSSFLISDDSEKEYMLVDCGYNVMQRLTSDDSIDIGKISTVIITHMDEDHIGNLKMFIYYRYFILKKTTHVVAGNQIRSSETEKNLKNYLNELNTELIGGIPSDCDMFYLYQPEKSNFRIDFLKVFHGGVSSYGVFIEEKESGEKIFISGDTKANAKIEEYIRKKCFNGDLDNFKYIFHDYSNWDNVTRNVHACKTDWELEYSEEFRQKAIKYHNNEDYEKEWRE